MRSLAPASAVLLLLSACAPAAMAPERFTTAPLALRGDVRASHPDRTASWIAPNVDKSLLYVADTGAGDVYLYNFPAGMKVGTISGLADPTGLCVNSAAAIWVVESRISRIVKFAHGARTRNAAHKVAGAQRLTDCAVDPASGNLAVTDLGGAAGPGALWVFANAQGTPTEYQRPEIDEMFFCTYDGSGNLFVDALTKSYSFELLELPAGASKLQPVSLNHQIVFPGAVRWDGQYLAIGDQAYQNEHSSAIYQFSVTGSTGSLQGTTLLKNSCDILGFTIDSGIVVAPDACKNITRFYKYPHGGGVTKTLDGFQYPVDAAVSIKQ